MQKFLAVEIQIYTIKRLLNLSSTKQLQKPKPSEANRKPPRNIDEMLSRSWGIKTQLLKHSKELRTDISKKKAIGCPSATRTTCLQSGWWKFKTAKINR